jgi:hypothetical protein
MVSERYFTELPTVVYLALVGLFCFLLFSESIALDKARYSDEMGNFGPNFWANVQVLERQLF